MCRWTHFFPDMKSVWSNNISLPWEPLLSFLISTGSQNKVAVCGVISGSLSHLITACFPHCIHIIYFYLEITPLCVYVCVKGTWVDGGRRGIHRRRFQPLPFFALPTPPFTPLLTPPQLFLGF